MRDPHQPPPSLLRPRDQPAIMGLIASCIILLVVVFIKNGGDRGGLVDVDRARPLIAKYQVDANRADWPELVQLPGVGAIMAQKWIAERERNGPFRDLEDLSRVDGIGPKTLDRLRPYVAPIMKDAAVATR